MKQLSLFFLLYSINIFPHEHSGIFILIHGTWGSKSDWYKPESEFFKTLEQSARTINHKVIPFMWSGCFNHESRNVAGAMLAKLIQSYPHHMHITIVAHSHGGNAAIIASQILAHDPYNKHKIDALFTLGTPINEQSYKPDMSIIKKIYNFFSYEDKVQTIFGFFEREFQPHPTISNIRIFIEQEEPGHAELTSEIVAHWIPFIHEDLAAKKIGNFDKFKFIYPGIIYFYSKSELFYMIEATRLRDIENDRCRARKMTQKDLKKISLGKLPDSIFC